MNLKPAGVHIVFWNANSLYPKRYEFEGYLRENDVDIALILETFLQTQTLFQINNYKIYRNDRANSRGGGTAIIVKNSISHSPNPPIANTSIEHTSVTLNMENSQILIISAYKPPHKRTTELDYSNLLNRNIPTLLAGGLNSKNTSWGCRKTNPEGRKLLNYAQDLQFQIHAPSEPTHYDHNTSDILDIAISKDIYHILHPETTKTPALNPPRLLQATIKDKKP
ncbi:hypothetical protein D910_07930 [Dendroctonus ponderosae]|uniref:Endonuclease/exonuclease/phosphatase domain-containing protein n=1 Tax=Dendroctonus ponderosae TaxID=77166 RepID=U4UE35_DENPD|nr:hypothetical protein D910_07930 [Dendroctonus ponderosae]